MSNLNEIQSLLKARYDLLYVVSHEEERVAADILSVANALGLNVCSWTFTSGIKMLNGTVEITVNEKNKTRTAKVEDGAFAGQPTRILATIRDCNQNCVFILNDYHSYFKDAEVVRELKDTLLGLKSSYTPVVVVSSVLKVPVEIEKMVTVLDYELPTRDELFEYIDNIVQQLSEEENSIAITDDVKEAIVNASRGLTIKEIDNIVTRSLVEHGTLEPTEVMYQKKQAIKKSGILEYYEASESMADVGGMDILKDWLRKRKSAFTEEAKNFGLPTPKGLLLLGIPGTGKTLMCKAIAKEWSMPLLRLDIGAVMQGIVGSSEENMRKVIQIAKSVSPCVLWIK